MFNTDERRCIDCLLSIHHNPLSIGITCFFFLYFLYHLGIENGTVGKVNATESTGKHCR